MTNDVYVPYLRRSLRRTEVVLALFLKFRLSVWVSIGIPICFLGTLWLMPTLGVSINLLSCFAFILVLGIVVDDAIVVVENVERNLRRQRLARCRHAVRRYDFGA